ncbi:SDR family NAD(P)-dependent oxidoreductase [Streptomyces sp. SCUT-3]|uniref:SDR family NAD(P)-dependent oxidoreductase n=1 Tax=Streptomyces sp. SCUT-3 TaxID=2684469 RepID=UPI0015F949DD|nr:SDR family NAD(P)-dependent oxidoreductase [Streptomyces sp. SCUT-3]QMV20549.1 SDR family NAD(P)-dependent oxidoreductase [Streptomyces sp. SCUT-3]
MSTAGSKVLVVGATGAVGGALAGVLHGRGARLAAAGRDAGRLAERARGWGDCPARVFDAYDVDGCAALAGWAWEALSGLDAVVTAVGTVAFGRSEDTSDEVLEHLVAVNALAPIAVLRAALPLLPEGGAVAAVTGVAERPMPGAADYSASKAALSAWLTAVRREQRRRGVHVLDARLPHMDTGFADRAVAGSPPPMPPGADLGAAVRAVVDALASGAAVVRPGAGGSLVTETRER